METVREKKREGDMMIGWREEEDKKMESKRNKTRDAKMERIGRCDADAAG